MLKRGERFAISAGPLKVLHGGNMDYDETLDAVGMMCPMPIVELSRKMKELAPGTVLEIRADDEGVVEDIPSWCNRTGNEYLGHETEGEVIKSYVKKM
jgi:tRNA 2-thiouridine synthesizing protein A